MLTPIKFENSLAFAKQMDADDPLKQYRNQFYIPQVNGANSIYFCGNSLGLQPKTVQAHVQQELDDWANLGVEGHFEGKYPWFHYQHYFTKPLANLVGAKEMEVVAMNALTVNLHLLMATFYKPTEKRFKILIEDHAFPSDRYTAQSQAAWHGFDADEAVVIAKARPGEYCLRTQDIVDLIRDLGSSLALVLLPGVQYYTGQLFNMAAITEAAHGIGAVVGFDLAHTIGNVPLSLNQWQVDFAAWCSYKYLNSGPGGVSGIFVHEKHGNNTNLHRLAGWWGNDEKLRFTMPFNFEAQKGAGGWQMSNLPIMSMAPHKASLQIFEQVGMQKLRAKSELLTAYLAFLLHTINEQQATPEFTIITPINREERGCQLSILTKAANGQELFNYLKANGVVADWRKPNVIRVAPVPLYNTFEDVFTFARLISDFLNKDKK